MPLPDSLQPLHSVHHASCTSRSLASSQAVPAWRIRDRTWLLSTGLRLHVASIRTRITHDSFWSVVERSHSSRRAGHDAVASPVASEQ